MEKARPTEAADETSSAASRQVGREPHLARKVQYIKRPDYMPPNTGEIFPAPSSALSRIKEPRLRYALYIADVMQALDFPKPAYGPAGGVVAVTSYSTETVLKRMYISD